MGREILFRGKHIATNKWIYGVPISNSNITCIFTLDDGVSKITGREIKPKSLGQYTGLTDKAGTKIFEGDILDIDGQICKVVYNGYRFEADGFNNIFYDDASDGFENMKYVKVIGNIYDNPDLLKEV